MTMRWAIAEIEIANWETQRNIRPNHALILNSTVTRPLVQFLSKTMFYMSNRQIVALRLSEFLLKKFTTTTTTKCKSLV